MRKLSALIVFAALLAGCGGGDDDTPPMSTPASAEVQAEEEAAHDLKGYSEGVKRYYGSVHSHGEIDDPNAAIEAEYHQPPVPPENALGGAITLTATNIGVRLKVTPTKVDTVRGEDGERYTAVHLTFESTGITIFDSEMNGATVTYGDGKPVPLDPDAKAECSNGLDGNPRLEVGASMKGCLLFPEGDGEPTRFQLALEQVPAEAGGVWNLG
jgi:hypothetical protein